MLISETSRLTSVRVMSKPRGRSFTRRDGDQITPGHLSLLRNAGWLAHLIEQYVSSYWPPRCFTLS